MYQSFLKNHAVFEVGIKQDDCNKKFMFSILRLYVVSIVSLKSAMLSSPL